MIITEIVSIIPNNYYYFIMIMIIIIAIITWTAKNQLD